jgi:N-acetyl-gamma-glutamyl-phosphate reductase
MLASGRWPSIAGVERTNCCDIAIGCDETGTHLVISSAIDNLVKGAAGQAIQCMNLRFGFDETTALGIARRTHARSHANATATATATAEEVLS